MQNEKVAKILNRIADFMEMKGDVYRMKAYRNAAHSVETLSKDIEDIAFHDQLKDLPGIGTAIAAKITEIIETGSLQYFEKLKKEYPVDFDALMAVEGLGPKTIKLFYEELGIKNLDDLERYAKRHHLRRLKGMGDKKERKILDSIEFARKHSSRKLLGYIMPLAESLKKQIEETGLAEQVEIAGSIRRRKESVGDIDILVISEKTAQIMDFFISMGEVAEIVINGPLKSTVRLKSGIECDLRVFGREVFGAALMYFTGSKELNVELRKLSISKGLKLSEYGLFEGKERVAGQSEKEIFNYLGLEYIAPEMRENRGEVEAAINGRLPDLISYSDINGDLETHSNWSDGKNTIGEMGRAAYKMGYEYMAITDHTGTDRIAGGLGEDELIKQMRMIDDLNDEFENFTILKGLEVNIDFNGNLDISNDILKDMDIVVGSVHSGKGLDVFGISQRILKAMENEYVNIIAHPTGRKIQEEKEYDLNLDKIFETSAGTDTFLEINSHPNRLDLRDIYIKKAVDFGCKLVINSDAHSINDLGRIDLGVATARRGWAEKKDVINTMNLKKLQKLLSV
ncbi:DNA polymerase/3'-5' exonuclease PolX [Methanobacterium alcaliphilum]|uniref:DNA polymerase/3'-5' exonuclease PolX n=1 Tax=Methanobacterium alcaliphilum TaxID=392018 RepID=UPI00200A4985|nr:DNA polymerase/3'-5' exonuclease PolX [Methanobacterium alcaliphilum]MCK9151710.1 DNA polymerase/3'-5' exonuclease PolX [Methanobacterium alcaliphilum]